MRLLSILLSFSLLLPLTFSCQRKNQVMNERKPVTEELSGEVLHFDDVQVPSPVLLSSCGELLLVKTSDSNAKIALCRVDGDSVKVVDRGIKKGRGPYEFIYANYCVSGDSLFVMDSNPMGFTALYGIPLKKAGALSVYSCWKHYVGSGFPQMRTVGYFIRSSPGRFVACAGEPGNEQIFSLLDFNNSVVTPMVFWPDDGNECETEVKQMVYMNSSLGPGPDGLFAYAADRGRYLAIMGIDGNGIAVKNLIYDVLPKFTSQNHNVRYDKAQHAGIIVKCTDERIYAKLYRDDFSESEDYKGYPSYCFDEIEIYDWDGRFIKCIRTDRPYSTFCPSSDDRYLYTTSIDLETGGEMLLRYELK